MTTITEMYRAYNQSVLNNPCKAANYESAMRWMVLLLGGKVKSHFLAELLYTSSNLVTLHNDAIISNGSRGKNETLSIWLTVIEYCEVLLENVAQRYGDKAKWIAVTTIQITKILGRLHLLGKQRKRFLIGNPPFSPLDRAWIEENGSKDKPYTLILSECHLRKDGTWMSFLSENKSHIAEVLFLLKPIGHILSLFYFGEESWVPWLLAASMDISSLYLHSQKLSRMRRSQALIVYTRLIRLFLYLLRSPFYDLKMVVYLFLLLNKIRSNLPILNTFTESLMTFFPRFRETYFYLWSY